MAVKAAPGIIRSHQLLHYSLSLSLWMTDMSECKWARGESGTCDWQLCSDSVCLLNERASGETRSSKSLSRTAHGSILYCRHGEILARADARGKKGRRGEKELYFRRGFRWVAFVMEGEDGVISLSVCFRLSLRAPVRKMDELPRELTGSR